MLITHDVFDIADRLKEVDPSYTLHYDRGKGRYELHGKRGELLLVYPFKSVDARMVTLARETRVERMREFIAEMDRKNLAIERAREKEEEESALERLTEIAGRYYASKK